MIAVAESLVGSDPNPPHDTALEPRDETVAEVQSLVCASRQLEPDATREDLLLAASAALAQLIDAPTQGHAVALAAFALRLREEHL